jgi:hypothetical protein
MPSLPPAQTPLYNHPLPAIEAWLAVLGAVQQPGRPCFWRLRHGGWSADLELGVEDITVVWQPFKYTRFARTTNTLFTTRAAVNPCGLQRRQ